MLSLNEAALKVLHDFWYCGKCDSLIPRNYWHRCAGAETHSGPHEPRKTKS